MEKKNIDWANIGFGYMPTDYRFVANYKDGAWDEGELTTDANITISEPPVAASLLFLTQYVLRYTIVHHAIHARKATAIRISKYSAI